MLGNAAIAFVVAAVAVVAIVAALVALGKRAARRRVQELGVLAAKLGFSFDPSSREGRPDWSEPFTLFQRDYPYEMSNRFAGESRGRPVEVFDYTYSDMQRDRDGTPTHRFNYQSRTVIVLEVPNNFPDLSIEPESSIRSSYGHLRGHDTRFGADEFDRAFYIECRDKAFAKALVVERVIDLLLRNRDVALQMIGSHIIFHRERTLDALGIEQLLLFAADFHDRIPDNVKKDYARA